MQALPQQTVCPSNKHIVYLSGRWLASRKPEYLGHSSVLSISLLFVSVVLSKSSINCFSLAMYGCSLVFVGMRLFEVALLQLAEESQHSPQPSLA